MKHTHEPTAALARGLADALSDAELRHLTAFAIRLAVSPRIRPRMADAAGDGTDPRAVIIAAVADAIEEA